MAEPSTSSSKVRLRKDDSVYLLGSVCDQVICGGKLPSNRQALSVLFFNIRNVKLTLRDSSALVIDEIFIFWQKARIPTRRKDHCVKQLENLHGDWRKLQKGSSRKSEIQKQNENKFIDKLDDLFDIAHLNAESLITNEQDRQFLLMQRQKGRPGCMLGKDMVLAKAEKRKQDILEKENERKKKALRDMAETSEYVLKTAFYFFIRYYQYLKEVFK